MLITIFFFKNASESTTVVVKTLNASAAENEADVFIKEMKFLADFKHDDNIVTFIGQVSISFPLMIVMEYCLHGNLRDYLRKVKITYSHL